ncbi:hypothetical protein FKM82_008145 [Ascaphus truei]
MIERDGHERRQVEPVILTSLVYCVLLLWTKEISALADFSGYLAKLLQNHTVYACDGDHLTLQCPRHSTISIQSAFYGRPVHSYPKCANPSPETMHKSSVSCVAQTAFQKVLDECQDLRSCQLPVISRVFGPDPCPGTTKYLLVSYKCKPTEYKSRSVCENNELKLHCKEPKLLNIYSAVYGRFAHEKNACPTAVDRGTPYDVKLDPHESRLPKRDGIFLSNSLAAFAYIKDHPEKAALFFVSSVCIGLIFTLLALATRVSWRSDWRKLPQMNGQIVREKARDDDSSEEEEGEDEASLKSHFSEEFRELCKSQRPVYSAMDAADLAERIERREQIIQEIWMNSGLDLPPNTHTSPFI